MSMRPAPGMYPVTIGNTGNTSFVLLSQHGRPLGDRQTSRSVESYRLQLAAPRKASWGYSTCKRSGSYYHSGGSHDFCSESSHAVVLHASDPGSHTTGSSTGDPQFRGGSGRRVGSCTCEHATAPAGFADARNQNHSNLPSSTSTNLFFPREPRNSLEPFGRRGGVGRGQAGGGYFLRHSCFGCSGLRRDQFSWLRAGTQGRSMFSLGSSVVVRQRTGLCRGVVDRNELGKDQPYVHGECIPVHSKVTSLFQNRLSSSCSNITTKGV